VQDKRVFGPARYFPTTNPGGVTNPPLAVWQLDGREGWLNDRTANGRDLSIVTGSFEFSPDELMGLSGAVFDSQDHELIAPAEEALIIAQNELGTDDASLTLEAIVRPTANNGAIFDCAGGGESLATNYLWTLGSEWDDAGVRKYYSFLEYGAGANANVYSNAVVRLNWLMYLAMTISADGLTFKWYRDGTLIGTGTATHRAEKNSAGGNTQRIRIGRREADDYDFRGLICGLRITNETFTDADISDAWDSIKGYSVGVVDPIVATNMEEQIVFPPTSGPARHSVLQTNVGTPKEAPAPMEEQITFPFQGGAPDHGPLANTHGKAVRLGGGGFFEEITIEIGDVPEFNKTTLDADGNNHFIGSYPRAYRAFFYNTVGERWANPTSYPDFTGYGRNGTHYTAGVQDAGPVYAPWYSEAFSANRGTRGSFPVKSLIVVAWEELCIFDLDSFDGSVASLKLWMRFRLDGGATYFKLAGRGYGSIRDVKMVNGLLVLGQQHTGWENGRIILIDFKGDDAYKTGNLIGSDNHYRWNSDITHRNDSANLWTTSGVSPSLRQNNERVYSVSPFVDENGTIWVAQAGEDDLGVIRIPTSTDRPERVYHCIGPDIGTANLDDETYRNVLFDRLGLLWFTIGDRIYRNFTYREGVLEADISKSPNPSGVYRSTLLPGEIDCIVEVQNYIFASIVGKGIYAVHRGNMGAHLAYTPVGGGGNGTRLIPAGGELFTDDGYPMVKGLNAFSLALANYLAINTELPRGGLAECTIIRTTDDAAPASFTYPTVVEPRAWFHVIIV